jgi:hypothetical protein
MLVVMLARSAMKNEKTRAKRSAAMIASAMMRFAMRRRRDGVARAAAGSSVSSFGRFPNPKSGSKNDETAMIIMWIMSESPENGVSEGIIAGVGRSADIVVVL